MNLYLIIIPAYNEEKSLEKVILDVNKANTFADVLVVNDGSHDSTSEVARKTGVMVLDLPSNLGYGGALQTGFRFAAEHRYEYVISLDADGQHDPSSAKNLIESMKRENADVVIGSRFMEEQYRMGIFRKLGSRMFSFIARLYTGIKFTDPTSGYQLLNRKVFSYLSKADNYPLDYPDINIIMALYKMKFKVVEAPVIMLEKKDGKSMHSGLAPLFYVLRMFLAMLMITIRRMDKI